MEQKVRLLLHSASDPKNQEGVPYQHQSTIHSVMRPNTLSQLLYCIIVPEEKKITKTIYNSS